MVEAATEGDGFGGAVLQDVIEGEEGVFDGGAGGGFDAAGEGAGEGVEVVGTEIDREALAAGALLGAGGVDIDMGRGEPMAGFKIVVSLQGGGSEDVDIIGRVEEFQFVVGGGLVVGDQLEIGMVAEDLVEMAQKGGESVGAEGVAGSEIVVQKGRRIIQGGRHRLCPHCGRLNSIGAGDCILPMIMIKVQVISYKL